MDARFWYAADETINKMSQATMTNTQPRPAGDFAERDDPFALFSEWFNDASDHEINDPNAMILSTVDDAGLPNVRTVLLKAVDGADAGPSRGFTWFTNYESAKGRELAANPRAALLFYWKSLRRQVRLRGPVKQVTAAEGDAYFASRQRGSQIGAWASQQSRPMANMAELEAAVTRTSEQFPDSAPVPRPENWSGYRLTPVEIEFWHDRPFRLHERVVFRRENSEQSWARQRLYP